MAEFTHLIDLASARHGGRAVAANDEFFAPKENLLKPEPPVFLPDKYTDRGKWMDGWETRRRRTPGHDWCIVRLGLPGVLKSVIVDTAFFRGNFPSHCSIDGCSAAPFADDEAVATAQEEWTPILQKSELRGDSPNVFAISSPRRFTHLRLNIHPDGGVARFRALGEALPDLRRVLAGGGDIDLATMVNGGHVVDTSDRFFGDPQNMLRPDRAPNMGDGWETRRRRGPGYDWSIVRLGVEGTIRSVEIDTAHFKGNYPESCSLEAGESAAGPWTELLPRALLRPDYCHVFGNGLVRDIAASYLRLNIYPDGGVSRLRVFCEPTANGRRAAMLRLLNAMGDGEIRSTLKDCCAAPRWIARMAAARPFQAAASVFAASDDAFDRLGDSDWLEAFRHHPRIGERQAERSQSDLARAWSADEQAEASKADADARTELAEMNRAYETRFGYVFIVCATGKSTGELLDQLRQRMSNPPDGELRTAAGEQRSITRLRLEKLLS